MTCVRRVCCCVLCVVLQGDMQYEDRDRVVGEFRRGETKILISTDVLARGFDVSQVGHLLLGLMLLVGLTVVGCRWWVGGYSDGANAKP